MSFLRNRRWWKPLALCGLLLTWALPAFAGGTLNPAGNNAWALYVFGNGQVVYAILNSVSAMVNDSGYHALMEFVGVLGIFGAAIVSGFDASKMPRMLAFVIGAFITLYISLNVTANIMVEDPITNYTNVATGVPAVVGVPAAVISDIGHWLTLKIEQDFSLPSDLTVSGGDGFNLANSLAQAATQAQILDPYLRNSFSAYTENCVIPELANGTMNADTLLNATNMWGALQVNNQGILTPVYSAQTPSGSLESCTNAYSAIGTSLTNEAQTLLTANSSQWGTTGASLVSNELSSALAFLSNNSVNQPADQSILQAATINMFNGSAMQQGEALTGNNGMMISMALAQSTQSQESSWYTGAQIFNSLMGYIYSVLQAFLFAITPILMAAVLIPGFGFAILKNFFQVLLWLILWQPMLAIINYIMSLYGQQAYGGVLASASGLTDMNLPVISAQSAHMALAAGFLGTMVPMIAWGLVKGSLAFSDFIMSAGGGAFASQAAQQAASGNETLNNQSMNNDSFNSKNFAHSLSTGQPAMDTAFGIGSANDKFQVGGTGLANAQGAISYTSTGGTKASTGTTGSSAHSASTSYADQHARDAAASAQVNSAVQHGSQIAQAAMSKLSVNQTQTAAENATYSNMMATSAQLKQDTAQQATAAIERSLQLQLNALGLGLGGISAIRNAGMAAGAETAVEEAAMNGGSAEDLVRASGGKLSPAEAEEVVAKRAQNLQKLKDDPKFAAKLRGVVNGAKKWAEDETKDPEVRNAVEATAVVAIAAGTLLGVTEVAAGIGVAGEGVAALAEGGETADLVAESATTGETAGETAGETTGATTGATTGETAESAPTGKPTGEPEDNPAKDDSAPKGKPNKRTLTGGLLKALEAASTDGKMSSVFKQANSSGTSQSLSRTGTQSNANAKTAGRSTSLSDAHEKTLTVQNTLQAIKGQSQGDTSSVKQALTQIKQAQHNYTEAQIANRSKDSAETISVPVAALGAGGGSIWGLGQLAERVQAKADSTPLVSQAGAAEQQLTADAAGADSNDALKKQVDQAMTPALQSRLDSIMRMNPGAGPGAGSIMTNAAGLRREMNSETGKAVLKAANEVAARYNGINGRALSDAQFVSKVAGIVRQDGLQVSNSSVLQMLQQEWGEATHNIGQGTGLNLQGPQKTSVTPNFTNPGNVMQGAGYVVYPSRTAGIRAAAQDLQGHLYTGLTVGQAVERYEGYSPAQFMSAQDKVIRGHVKAIASDLGVNPSQPFDQGNLKDVSELTSQLLIFEEPGNRGITPSVVRKSLSA